MMIIENNMITTKQELLETGCYMMNRPVEKEYEEFKKTDLFRDSEFVLKDFLSFLGFNDKEIKIAIMQRTEQIEDYNTIFGS